MAPLHSWLEVPPKSHFSIYNIPFGIISTGADNTPRPAVALGDHALDLRAFAQGNGFAALSTIQPHQTVFSEATLNAFAALGRPMHRIVREYLQSVFLKDGPFSSVLETNTDLQKKALVRLADCTMHLPMKIGDYTDFYAGLHHAYSVGVMFRGPQNALQPNYKHLPVGYHGRASSCVISGTPIRRPNGQILLDPTTEVKHPVLSPSRKLDIELELGCFVCTPSALGEPVRIGDAPNHLFGMVLLNDWSARDIQAWEYVPLGPFNSKNFATSVSPWVVLMDALEPFVTHGIGNDTKTLSYLDEKDGKSHVAIDLAVDITTVAGNTLRLSQTSAKNLLFSFPQMLTHHTIGGCPFSVGDLMGSGTISGSGQGEKGCLLEQTENGKVAVDFGNGEQRMFLEDGDTISLTGVCGSQEGALVGFGKCSGTVKPALDLSAT